VTPLERALLRFLGLYAVWAGVELLERTAYRAGVSDAGDVAAAVLDDLEAADLSDVLEEHADRCAGADCCPNDKVPA
jgi:hypothetical protein